MVSYNELISPGPFFHIAGRSGEGEEAEESLQKQRRRRKQPNPEDGDVDKRLCTNEELSMPRDARSLVLDNFLLECSKERDGKIRESCVPASTASVDH
jgi:hypothetical protein